MSKSKRIETRPSRQQETKIRPPETGLLARLWNNHRASLVPIAGFYLLITIFFAPVVFQGRSLSPAADMVAAAGMFKTGEEAIGSGRFPLWNPTLFSGLPMFASLQYALFVYPPEYLIRVFSHIFGGGDYRIWLFHYLIAAWLAYLLARHYGCGRLTAWLAGAAYGFSPQLIVLAEVGHGSKLMAMTWLPLIWLLLERLRGKPSAGRMAALGSAFAVQILALHPQVAAYGAMLMGLYLVFWGIAALTGKEHNTSENSPVNDAPVPLNSPLRSWGRFVGWFAGAMVLSLALSAVLWFSVLDYARFSTRGGSGGGEAVSTGGGVSWDYATGWSFHPFESLTFVQPYIFGFGNETYWGTVGTPDGTPFTHNPMYFGVVILLLAIVGTALTPRRIWGFALTLALCAWVLSFGRYLPILYGPFYHLLPMFNKFRAPVMGQVLLLLPMALLAGVGLEALIKRIREGSVSRLFLIILTVVGAIFGLRGLIVLLSEGTFWSIYRNFASFMQPATAALNPRAFEATVSAAGNLFRPDLLKVSAIIVVLIGLTVGANRRKIPPAALGLVFLCFFLIDLWPVNRKLVNFTPTSSVEALFQPEGVVKRLQKDNDKFRIAPLDNRYKPANWWSYFGIESVGGYFGAKPGAYQKLMTAAGLETWDCAFRYPKVLDALNVRYILLTFPLDYLFEELEKQGQGAAARPAELWQLELMPREMRPNAGPFLYRNPGALPRARLVGEHRVIPDLNATLHEMTSGRTWEPAREVLLERDPDIRPEPGGGGSAVIDEYLNERITISVDLPSPKILVLADEYYPSGWSVFIDGREGEILRADGVLRGVALPAGDHKVVFTFRPKLFYAGLWTSLISLLMVIGVGVTGIIRKRPG